MDPYGGLATDGTASRISPAGVALPAAHMARAQLHMRSVAEQPLLPKGGASDRAADSVLSTARDR